MENSFEDSHGISNRIVVFRVHKHPTAPAGISRLTVPNSEDDTPPPHRQSLLGISGHKILFTEVVRWLWFTRFTASLSTKNFHSTGGDLYLQGVAPCILHEGELAFNPLTCLGIPQRPACSALCRSVELCFSNIYPSALEVSTLSWLSVGYTRDCLHHPLEGRCFSNNNDKKVIRFSRI